MASRKVASRKKKTPRRKTYVDVLPPIDVCGQVIRIVEDNDLRGQGESHFDDGMIKLRTKIDGAPVFFWRLLDTFIHEVLHWVFENPGTAWQIRQRLKMSVREYQKFEEDFLIRPLTPALVSTLLRAGLLKLPALPGRPARRRGLKTTKSRAR